MIARAAMACAAAMTLLLGSTSVSYGKQTLGSSKVLYQSTWPAGGKGWLSAGGSWKVGAGVLNYDGQSASVSVAPYTVSTRNYAVEARVRLVGWKNTGLSESHGFGLLIRAQGVVDPGGGTAGLMAGVGKGFVGCDGLESQAAITTANLDLESLATKNNLTYAPGHGWHTYRAEVRGNVIKLSSDGHLRLIVTTSRYATGKRVGLFSLSTQIQVKSFKVSAL